MTFKEYLKQKDPVKQHIGTVSVDEDDCFAYWKSYKVFNSVSHYGEWAWVIDLRIGSMHIEYLKLPQSDALYTMDEDGNKKRMSVFKLNFEL